MIGENCDEAGAGTNGHHYRLVCVRCLFERLTQARAEGVAEVWKAICKRCSARADAIDGYEENYSALSEIEAIENWAREQLAKAEEAGGA